MKFIFPAFHKVKLVCLHFIPAPNIYSVQCDRGFEIGQVTESTIIERLSSGKAIVTVLERSLSDRAGVFVCNENFFMLEMDAIVQIICVC